MAKATTTIRQVLNYPLSHETYFAANQSLFNQVASFYFEVIQAHEKILDLGNMDALRALEQLTHTTKNNPHPVMPLTSIGEDVPAMFRRAAINAALGSARSFYANLARWRKRKEMAEAKGKQDNAALWTKIRHVDEQVAHLVSSRIVQFAKKHEATILVFEHLGNLKSEKGKYSRRGNSKRAFWMKGRIFKYAKYKAYNSGILTSRVSPRNTSRECTCCHSDVSRYSEGQPTEGYTYGAPLVYCAKCGMKGNADRNACLVIGKRLVERYEKSSKEKPQTLLAIEREEQSSGVVISQDAESVGTQPSPGVARHGDHNGHGTAQGQGSRMVEPVRDIAYQLRLPF